MKTTYSVLFCVVVLNSMAQSNFNLNLSSSTGFEYNVFNANEEQIIIRDGIEEPALQRGYFQRIRIASGWSIKSKHHTLKINGAWQQDYFPELKVANLTRPSARVRYTLKINKRHSFSLTARYRGYQTNRPEDDTEVLRPPRAYNRYETIGKYVWKPFKGTTMDFQGGIVKQMYKTDELRTFFYDAWESGLGLNQRLFKGKRHSHSLEVRGEYAVRHYFDAVVNPDTDDETIREREWRYIRLTGNYSWSFRKRLKVSIGATADERQDMLQNRFGYRQYQSFIKIALKSKKFDFSVRGSAARRDYHTLRANSESVVLLRHDYLRANLNFAWKISKRFHIIGRASAIRRIRNLPEGARSFLSYDNALVSLGLKINLF
ncbi:MAG: hypothetical protein AAGA77_20000 [Bacteroidota bacterium]